MISRFGNASVKFQKEVDEAIRKKSEIELRNLNDRMVNVEKSFIYSLGLPNQQFNRHVIFASSYTPVSAHFPGISDLMFSANKTERNWKEIKKQVSIVFKSISSAAETLDKDAK